MANIDIDTKILLTTESTSLHAPFFHPLLEFQTNAMFLPEFTLVFRKSIDALVRYKRGEKRKY